MKGNNKSLLGLTVHEGPPPHIKFADIEAKLNKKQYAAFSKWICGQTTHTEGVYPWDFERWVCQGMKTK